jgi:nicotinate-nucleotide adenylyltransferase
VQLLARDADLGTEAELTAIGETRRRVHHDGGRVDIDRDGPTYTIDTLRELHTSMPSDDLHFITGADALAQILTWRDHHELFELAHFVGVTRPGHPMSPDIVEGLPEDRITLMEIPALAISSTDCRERVHGGEPVWYLVPDGVVQYIGKHGLYR